MVASHTPSLESWRRLLEPSHHVRVELVQLDDVAVDVRVELLVGRKAVGVVADPAVMVDGHVQRLARVAHEVRELAHLEQRSHAPAQGCSPSWGL